VTDDVVVREMAAEELTDAFELGAVTFGQTRFSPPVAAPEIRPDLTHYGAFDARGRLVGKLNDLHHEQWWSGREIAAADIAGVAVRPEARGRGIARALLRHLLEQARERGAMVSALFPTVAAVYRSAGWTMAGARRGFDIPTALLAGRHRAEHLTVRPADPAELTVVDDLYERIAESRNGLLTRTGRLFAREPDTFPEGIAGLTVVEDDTGPVAAATWGRESGYQADAILRVDDFLATSTDAARALLGVLASWRPVAPTARFIGVPSGVAPRELPLEASRPHRTDWWMFRPIDAPALIANQAWPEPVRVKATFTLVDELAAWNAGTWRLEIADGRASMERAASDCAPALHIEGLGALVCGTASPAILVESGLADEGLDDDLAFLAAVPRPELLNYF
jgi:predicted acetyltransferase